MLLRIAISSLAVLAGLAFTAPAAAQQTQRIKCESRNYQPATCNFPGLVDARIVQQLGGRCIQGETWGYTRQGVYVSNGCRAAFEVRFGDNGRPGAGYPAGPGYPGSGYPGGGYPGGGDGRTIRCESQNYRQVRCPVDTRGGVQVRQVLGNTPCRQGQTWGFDRGGIWVNGGCRADFIVGTNNAGGYPNPGYPGGGYPGGGYPGGAPGGRTITCSSINYRPASCPVEFSRGVQLQRVLGGECIEGRSWGIDRNRIWVNNGCRAVFTVY